jgi:hypothetical protein
MNNNEAFNNLYQRSKKLLERLVRPSEYEVPLKDQIIIANIEKEEDKENNNIKSYDTLDKADLLEYSIKPNGNLDNSKLKESISNTHLEDSENGSSDQKGGFITSEGKIVKTGIMKYNSLVIKYGKISFNIASHMNESFVLNNDIIYLESKIPIFKANNFGDVLYDTIKNYHQQGSDKEDKNNLVNINQTNTHKINLDENNFNAIAASKIFIFLHKVTTKANFRQKKDGSKKNISSAQSTEVIQKDDSIFGYGSLEMNKIFLADDFRYSGKINLLEKKKEKDKNEKSGKKGMKSSKSKEKIKNENQFNEKGERIIGTLEAIAYLKKPRQMQINDKFTSSIDNLIKNNDINKDNNNNINKINQSPMKEFIVGQLLYIIII